MWPRGHRNQIRHLHPTPSLAGPMRQYATALKSRCAPQEITRCSRDHKQITRCPLLALPWVVAPKGAGGRGRGAHAKPLSPSNSHSMFAPPDTHTAGYTCTHTLANHRRRRDARRLRWCFQCVCVFVRVNVSLSVSLSHSLFVFVSISSALLPYRSIYLCIIAE